jgi:hypothetical protein
VAPEGVCGGDVTPSRKLRASWKVFCAPCEDLDELARGDDLDTFICLQSQQVPVTTDNVAGLPSERTSRDGIILGIAGHT